MISPGFLNVGQNPDTKTLLDANSGHWFTRGELADRVAATADTFSYSRKAFGFLFATNDADSLITYLAAVEAGHAIVMLDPDMDSSLKTRLISLFQPDFIVAPESVWLDSSQYLTGSLPGSSQTFWRSRRPHLYPIHPDLTLLISTSGSTGSPKLIRLSRRNLESNAASINAVLGISDQDRAMVTTPIVYAYGLSVVNTHLAAGASLVVTRDRIVSHGFWDTARDSGCTSIGGTPYFYQLLDRLDLDSLAVPRLTKFVQAGGRLSEDLVRKYHSLIEKRGGEFHVMYGQAEATARISGLPPELLPEAVGSVGFPIPGGRLSVELDGRRCRPFEEGELVYQGPNVMMGYASSPSDLAQGDVLGGRLMTGDLGYCDDRGLFYITGRKARFVKLFGYRISLDDVEEMLSPAGPVAAVNENERIIVYCEENTPELSQHLQRLSERLRAHPSGFECRVIGRIPRLANGKTDYCSLAGALEPAL